MAETNGAQIALKSPLVYRDLERDKSCTGEHDQNRMYKREFAEKNSDRSGKRVERKEGDMRWSRDGGGAGEQE